MRKHIYMNINYIDRITNKMCDDIATVLLRETREIYDSMKQNPVKDYH